MLLAASEPPRRDPDASPGDADTPADGAERRSDAPSRSYTYAPGGAPPEPAPERPSENPEDRLPTYPHRAEVPPPPPRPETPEDRLPSYPRSGAPAASSPLLRRLLIGGMAFAALLLIVYGVTRERTPPVGSDVVERVIDRADQVSPSLTLTDPAAARRYVRDEFGWRIGVPVFASADLQGVGVGELAPMIEVPTLFYQDRVGREAVVFVLSYALLDQVPDRLLLSDDDYRRLVAERPSARHEHGRDVVLWRDRADLYIVVTDIPPNILVERITIER